MADEARIEALSEAIRYHRELYYNYSAPEISDIEFDKLWDELKTDAQYLNIEQQTCIRLAKKKIPIYEIEGREPKRIGGERKMRPLTTGAQLSYQIINCKLFDS